MAVSTKTGKWVESVVFVAVRVTLEDTPAVNALALSHLVSVPSDVNTWPDDPKFPSPSFNLLWTSN